MLGELTRKHKADGGLNLAGQESGLLVVDGKLPSLAGDALEDVVDKRVHDAHALLADAGIRVDLLEDLIDIGGVGFDALLAALLLALGGDLLGSLGRSLLRWCFSHGRKIGEREYYSNKIVRTKKWAGRGSVAVARFEAAPIF